MRSILSEITRLRGGKIPVIDYRNSNRYCVIASEPNGTKTAYCFGIPIYNRKTRKIVDMRFKDNNGVWISYGSGAVMTASDGVIMENEEGFCKVIFPGETLSGSDVRFGMAEVSPTLNGINIRIPCIKDKPYEVKLFSGKPFLNVRANDRCFSLMLEEFKPFVTVSCIGVLDSAGQIIAPCRLEYQKNSEREYAMMFRHSSPYGKTLLFEINLHEDKLFQDTTVESLHPDVNNAFGGTAFIGNTAAYGEQWLYSRPDMSKISQLFDKHIHKAVLYLPRLGGSGSLAAFGLNARFCSFGSNWENKVQAEEKVTYAVSASGYQSIDITGMITDGSHFLKPSEGFILKPKVKGGGFSAVSTGDSYFAPQILEVNYQ